MIDINGGSTNRVSARLSNFTARTFTFSGVPCASIEGVLQALKFDDGHELQAQICLMPPQTAKEMGTEFPQWKLEQKLFWNDQVYDRHSEAYQALITGLYDAAYEQDPTFKTDLLALGDAVICHSIGKSDPMDTVLTEAEFVYHLNRLRERILI